MINTIIDFEILKDYLTSSVKKDILDGADLNEEENRIKFYKFIKSGTNLNIVNKPDNKNKYSSDASIDELKQRNLANRIQLLETGRGDSKIEFNAKFRKPHKFVIKNKNPFLLYYLDEPDKQARKSYTRKNGFSISFLADYLSSFQHLALINKATQIPARKNVKASIFKGWDELKNYLLPFTDVVFTDNFILTDETLIPSNLEPILVQLDKATPVKYNLTLIVHEKYVLNGKTKFLNIHEEFERLNQLKQKHSLKADINLIFSTHKIKEHDRGIFMNYLRIKSGDTFNYFDSSGNVVTHGTDIEFYSMTEPDKINSAMAALENCSQIVQEIKKNKKETNFCGKNDNGLLNIFRDKNS